MVLHKGQTLTSLWSRFSVVIIILTLVWCQSMQLLAVNKGTFLSMGWCQIAIAISQIWLETKWAKGFSFLFFSQNGSILFVETQHNMHKPHHSPSPFSNKTNTMFHRDPTTTLRPSDFRTTTWYSFTGLSPSSLAGQGKWQKVKTVLWRKILNLQLRLMMKRPSFTPTLG